MNAQRYSADFRTEAAKPIEPIDGIYQCFIRLVALIPQIGPKTD